MKNNIGSIRMRKGKWQIFTHERGFRPGWQPFNKDYVIQVLKKTNLNQHRDYWINLINDDKYDELKEAVKAVTDNPYVPVISSLVNYLSMMGNIKTTDNKKEEEEYNGSN